MSWLTTNAVLPKSAAILATAALLVEACGSPDLAESDLWPRAVLSLRAPEFMLLIAGATAVTFSVS
jgi:hypothetical protein